MQASPLRGSRWAGKGAGVVSVSAVTRVVEFAGDATVSGGSVGVVGTSEARGALSQALLSLLSSCPWM